MPRYQLSNKAKVIKEYVVVVVVFTFEGDQRSPVQGHHLKVNS